MPVYAGFDVNSRERIYDESENNFESNREFGREVFRTAVGQEFLNTFESDDDTPRILLGAAHKLNPAATHITTSMVVSALKILMTKANCPFKRKVVEPEPAPVVDTRPRDKHGKLLTDAQIRWSQYTKFSNEATYEQRKEKIRTDPEYASFVRVNLHREMNSAPVDGALEPPSHEASPAEWEELQDFAQAFLQSPNRKPVNGLITLGSKTYRYPGYLELVNRCAAAKLI
jgi:hypothetical protein